MGELKEKREVSVNIPTSEATKPQQRPSLISILTGQGQQQPQISHDSRSGTGGHTPSDTLSQNTLNPPKGIESFSSSSTTTNKEPGVASESQSTGATPTPSLTATTSTTIIAGTSSVPMGGSVPHLPHTSSMSTHHGGKSHPPRLRFVQSVEFRHSSGERSTTPLSPESPAEDSSGETQKPHRLQRSKAQSRKTFRLKRNRPSHRDLLPPSGQLSKEAPASVSTVTITPTTSANTATVSPTSVVTTPPSLTVAPIKPVSDVSWDSVSQTSSTSGYRDNYSFQTGFLSPDDKTGSQHSLLMLFEAQDEDTLI